MIAKSNKFPTRVQFLSFRSRAKQITTAHLRILYESRAPNGAAGEVGSRLSVIVPVKVNKKAVVRNTLKRLVYDTMWQILRDKNQDCIVIFKPITLIKGVASNSLISAELKTIHV